WVRGGWLGGRRAVLGQLAARSRKKGAPTVCHGASAGWVCSRYAPPGPYPRRKLGIIFIRLYSAQGGHTAGRRREQSENHQAHLYYRREVRNETAEYHRGHGHPPIV